MEFDENRGVEIGQAFGFVERFADAAELVDESEFERPPTGVDGAVEDAVGVLDRWTGDEDACAEVFVELVDDALQDGVVGFVYGLERVGDVLVWAAGDGA